MVTIIATKVTAPLAQLVDPDESLWSRAAPQTIDMLPTPIGFQPSVYVIASWTDRPYGTLPRVSVRALHTGKELAIRLEWDELQPIAKPEEIDVFSDGAGILFPLDGKEAPIETMGSPEQPVNAWYWRANLEDAISATGQGVGTVQRLTDGGVMAKGRWGEGRWRVAFGRAFETKEGVPLAAPGAVNASVAVWRGANGERAGIKAFGQTWHEIRLES